MYSLQVLVFEPELYSSHDSVQNIEKHMQDKLVARTKLKDGGELREEHLGSEL
jgi:hypothetical protein